MNSDIQHLDLIDLISERHIQLRKVSEKLWSQNSKIDITNSEWFILARIYQKENPTISYVTKNVDISRQATHKFMKRLKDKGLVEIISLRDNKKEKGIQLTQLGIECFEKNEALKAEVVEKIAKKIGYEKVHLLKEILTSDWEI